MAHFHSWNEPVADYDLESLEPVILILEKAVSRR
jgi:hypothetical protein